MERRIEKAYIGLGSNMGDRLLYLRDAVGLLKNTGGIVVKKLSSVYETKPFGLADQPDFLNCVIEIETTLTPLALLDVCLEAESRLNRVRTIRWGPRTIDLDILLYGDSVIHEERLTIPHPRMAERAFALVPLAEIAPDAYHPVAGATIRELLESLKKLDGAEGVRLFESRV